MYQANDSYKVNKWLFTFCTILFHRPVSHVSLIHTSQRWIFCNKGSPKKIQSLRTTAYTERCWKDIQWSFSCFILPERPYFTLFWISLNTLGSLPPSWSIYLFNYSLTRYFFSCSNFSSYFLIFLLRLWRCLVSCVTVCGSLQSSQLHLEELLGLQKPKAELWDLRAGYNGPCLLFRHT